MTNKADLMAKIDSLRETVECSITEGKWDESEYWRGFHNGLVEAYRHVADPNDPEIATVDEEPNIPRRSVTAAKRTVKVDDRGSMYAKGGWIEIRH